MKADMVALFGEKGTVDRYLTFECLEMLSHDRDLGRRIARRDEKFSAAKEAEARARRK